MYQSKLGAAELLEMAANRRPDDAQQRCKAGLARALLEASFLIVRPGFRVCLLEANKEKRVGVIELEC
jgi:hypothetical protein